MQTSQPPDGPKFQANHCRRSECQEARHGPTLRVFSRSYLATFLPLPNLAQILPSYPPQGGLLSHYLIL